MTPLAPTFRVVRTNATDPDPSLSQENTSENVERYATYQRTRDPEALPSQVDGIEPTWFVLRRLPAAYLTSVIDAIYPPSAQREHALRAALLRVELPGEAALARAPTGSPKAAPFQVREAVHGVLLAGDDWVQEIADRYGAETIQELGQVALDHARLPRGRRGPFSSWAGTVAGR